MIRLAIASTLLAAGAALACGPAASQPVQYQFTPPPPIVALPSTSTPSYAPVPGVAPPVPSPGGSGVVPYHVTPAPSTAPTGSARNVYTRRGRVVHVPGPPGRGQDSFSDRVTRCVHAGAAAGIRPGELGSFTSQCAN